MKLCLTTSTTVALEVVRRAISAVLLPYHHVMMHHDQSVMRDHDRICFRQLDLVAVKLNPNRLAFEVTAVVFAVDGEATEKWAQELKVELEFEMERTKCGVREVESGGDGKWTSWPDKDGEWNCGEGLIYLERNREAISFIPFEFTLDGRSLNIFDTSLKS